MEIDAREKRWWGKTPDINTVWSLPVMRKAVTSTYLPLSIPTQPSCASMVVLSADRMLEIVHRLKDLAEHQNGRLPSTVNMCICHEYKLCFCIVGIKIHGMQYEARGTSLVSQSDLSYFVGLSWYTVSGLACWILSSLSGILQLIHTEIELTTWENEFTALGVRPWSTNPSFLHKQYVQ